MPARRDRQQRRESDDALRKRWIEYARQHLLGRVITNVDYLKSAQARQMLGLSAVPSKY